MTASNADVRRAAEVAVARVPDATPTAAPVLDSSTILEAPPWGFYKYGVIIKARLRKQCATFIRDSSPKAERAIVH